MYRNKISVPQPFQMIKIENREGIIYERIEGKTLQNIIIETNEAADTVLDMFVRLHLDILAHDSKNVLSYKEYLIAMLKNKKMISATWLVTCINFPLRKVIFLGLMESRLRVIMVRVLE